MKYDVVIPTRNRPELLQRALRSLSTQTNPPSRIVVVDDNSTFPLDRESLFSDGIDLKVIRLEPNAGPSVARNTAVNACTSPLIAFLDDDDEWLPLKMERQIAHFTADQRVVAASCWRKIIRAGTERRECPTDRQAGDYLFYDNFYGSCSFLVLRRADFLAVGGFDPQLHFAEDWDLLLRLNKRGPVRMVEEILAVYHQHQQPHLLQNQLEKASALRHLKTKYATEFPPEALSWLDARLFFLESVSAKNIPGKLSNISRGWRSGMQSGLPLQKKVLTLCRLSLESFLGFQRMETAKHLLRRLYGRDF